MMRDHRHGTENPDATMQRQETPDRRGIRAGARGEMEHNYFTDSLKFRQRIKGVIVMLAARGILPISWAELLLSWGGMAHD